MPGFAGKLPKAFGSNSPRRDPTTARLSARAQLPARPCVILNMWLYCHQCLERSRVESADSAAICPHCSSDFVEFDASVSQTPSRQLHRVLSRPLAATQSLSRLFRRFPSFAPVPTVSDVPVTDAAARRGRAAAVAVPTGSLSAGAAARCPGDVRRRCRGPWDRLCPDDAAAYDGPAPADSRLRRRQPVHGVSHQCRRRHAHALRSPVRRRVSELSSCRAACRDMLCHPGAGFQLVRGCPATRETLRCIMCCLSRQPPLLLKQCPSTWQLDRLILGHTPLAALQALAG